MAVLPARNTIASQNSHLTIYVISPFEQTSVRFVGKRTTTFITTIAGSLLESSSNTFEKHRNLKGAARNRALSLFYVSLVASPQIRSEL